MKKGFYVILYLIALVFVLFCSIALVSNYLKQKALKNNVEYTKAVITNFYLGTGMRYYLEYTFVVGEDSFHGRGKHYPKSDSILFGDSIVVAYDKENPTNNKPYRDFN